MKAERTGKVSSVPVGNGRKRQVGGSRGEKSLQGTKKGQTGDPNVSEGKKGARPRNILKRGWLV